MCIDCVYECKSGVALDQRATIRWMKIVIFAVRSWVFYSQNGNVTSFHIYLLLSNKIDEKQWILFFFFIRMLCYLWYRTKVDHMHFCLLRTDWKMTATTVIQKKKHRKIATELPCRSFIVSFRQTKLINGSSAVMFSLTLVLERSEHVSQCK